MAGIVSGLEPHQAENIKWVYDHYLFRQITPSSYEAYRLNDDHTYSELRYSAHYNISHHPEGGYVVDYKTLHSPKLAEVIQKYSKHHADGSKSSDMYYIKKETKQYLVTDLNDTKHPFPEMKNFANWIATQPGFKNPIRS